MDILSTGKFKARKDHKCNFCAGIIAKGTMYNIQTCVDSGIYSWKTHPECDKIANKLNMYEDEDEGVSGDAFRENIIQEYRSIQPNKTDISFLECLKVVFEHHKF